MNNQTHFKLKQLRLSGMADVYQELTADRRKMQALSVDEVLELMVDREVNRRRDSKHERLLKRAAFESSPECWCKFTFRYLSSSSNPLMF